MWGEGPAGVDPARTCLGSRREGLSNGSLGEDLAPAPGVAEASCPFKEPGVVHGPGPPLSDRVMTAGKVQQNVLEHCMGNRRG